MRKQRRIAHKQFETLFGIKPSKALSKEQQEKCRQSMLYSTKYLTCMEYMKKHCVKVRIRKTENPDMAKEVLSKFLPDVRTCPEEVIKYLQDLLREV